MRLFLLISLLCSLLACSGEPESLRIGGNRWPGYGPVYLADDLGWLQSQGIQLLEYPHATGVLRAFDNNLLDAALLTLDEALQLAARGHDLEILLITNISAGADVLYARPGIDRPQELAGQRIGVETGALGGHLLARTLELAGLAERDVQVVSLPIHEHAEALGAGRIDAAISFATEEPAFLAAGARRLLDTRALPDTVIDVLVVERGRISAQRREQLRALWFDSLREWHDNHEQADARLVRRLGIDQETLHLTVDGLQLGDRALNRRLLDDGRLAERLDSLHAFMRSHGLLANAIDTGSLLPAPCRSAQC